MCRIVWYGVYGVCMVCVMVRYGVCYGEVWCVCCVGMVSAMVKYGILWCDVVCEKWCVYGVSYARYGEVSCVEYNVLW